MAITLFEAIAKLALDTSDFDAGLDGARGSLDGAFSSGLGAAAKAGAAAIGAATTATVAFAKSAVDVGAGFDASMSQVAATMGVTTDEIGELRDFARQMGAETAFSATDAADALNYMALAGYYAETSMKMLPNVLNLAAAGGIDLASASNMVTDAQSALGLTLDETSDMVDKMAKASSKTNTSVAQLGDAFLTVGGTAKNLRGGTTELATALGLLADNGVKGSEGGTALRNIILSLAAPTKNASDALLQFGGAEKLAYDEAGNMRSLNDIFADLNAIMQDMTQAERTDLINTIFNKTDLKSVNALLDTTADKWAEVTDAIDGAWLSADGLTDAFQNATGYDLDFDTFVNSFEEIGVSAENVKKALELSGGSADDFADLIWEWADAGVSFEDVIQAIPMDLDELQMAFDATAGAAQVMADTQLDNLQGDMELLKSAIAEAQITLSDQLAPTLRTFAQAATDSIGVAATKFNEYFSSEAAQEKMQSMTDAITRVIDAIVNNLDPILDMVISVIDGVASAIAFLAEHFETITTVVGMAAAAFAGFKAVGIAQAIMGIVSAMSTAAATAGGLGAAIGAVVNPVGLVVAAIAAAAVLIVTHWDDIKAAWGQAVEFFSGIVSSISEAFAPVADFLGNVFSSAWNGIKGVWGNVADFFGGIVQRIVGVFTNLPKTFLDIGRNIMEGLGNGLLNALGSVVDKARSVAGSILGAVKGFFGIHSPSSVMREEVGQNIGKGAVLGLQDELSAATRASNDFSNALYDGLETEVPAVNVGYAQPTQNNARTETIMLQILDAIQKMGITIDGKAIVGYMAPEMNRALGELYYNTMREVSYA